ncbi:HamA C-terminal domain-containing protein [Pedobacter deserti]|uniref:HamA C-terminal domain-containing protein n=1 Tax=Pedobacter deserti TaxID=2817382 RepID=UPI00210BD457|nr:DUF1837 domain-containing protein [Pedobacter sp. SYSU D00382]
MTSENPISLTAIELVGQHQTGFKTRLKEIAFDWKTDGLRAEGSFFYLAFHDGQPTQDQFVEFIYYQVIPFCLDRGYIKESFEKVGAGDHQVAMKITDEAKNLFINAKKKNKKTGEPGEIILFALLEYALGAPRVLSKMQLKTNRNMEVYGSDGIHLKFDTTDGHLYLYWGEAKLYQNLSKAINRIALSVKGYMTKDGKGKTGRDYDISLIERHSDLGNEDATQSLIKFLDPYQENHEKLREVYACVAIWNTKIYEALEGCSPEQAEDIFKEKYGLEISTACESFKKKIHAHSLQNLRFHFFLVPIKNAQDFRKLFCDKIGIEFEDELEDELDGDDD